MVLGLILPNVWIPLNFTDNVLPGPVPAAVRFEPLTGQIRFRGSFVVLQEPAGGQGLLPDFIPYGYRPGERAMVSAGIEYLPGPDPLGDSVGDNPPCSLRIYPNGDVSNGGIYTYTRIHIDGISLIRGLLS